MRNITLTFICLFTMTLAFGQTKKQKSKLEGDKSQVPNLQLNFDIIKPAKTSTNKNTTLFTPPPSLNFQSLKETSFIVQSLGKEGHISWMKGYVDQGKAEGWGAKAKIWFEAASQIMSLDSEKTSFVIEKEWTDELNQTHLKMVQKHNGIKVYAGEVILHGKDGRLLEQNGFYVKSEKFNEAKSKIISSDEAIVEVSTKLTNLKKDWNVLNGINLKIEKEQWESELVYYPNSDGRYDLMYHIKVYPNLAEHYEYFVDGQTGEIVDYFSTICNFHHNVKSNHEHCNHDNESKKENAVMSRDAEMSVMPPDGPTNTTARDLLGSNRTINTYGFNNVFFLIDASRSMFNGQQSNMPDEPVGAIWTIDLNSTSPANSNAEYSHIVSNNNSFTGSEEGVSAHYNAGKAYEYYENTFNRQSIAQSLQGAGQTIHSFVNVADEFGNSMGNAFWNGVGIYYGNGDSAFNSLGRALDVAGHEMSHGVVQNSANLEYRNESGALNESFADIFGAMIDRDDWKMGEDVVKTSAFPSGALRDLSDPHNGAATGDYGRGWQPRHYNERFTGSQDNGGVHINSGIPNYAFYLFATNSQVGKERAEQVYYRAITTYLTKSSGFAEMRSAVVKSSQDLYGNDVVSAARSAFDQVGILGESDDDFQTDFEVNPGDDYLLEADQDLSNLYIKTIPDLEPFFNPLSTSDLLSKPSVTDDGSIIVFVGEDHHIHVIQIDWNANPPVAQEGLLSENPEWDNVAISKNGRFIAAIDMLVVPRIFVFDLLSGSTNTFDLYNPTTSNDGSQSSDVQYADVIEFDATGRTIMYDAYNEISGTSGEIGYYDIGFLNFWDNQNDTWAEGNIDKLFGTLPENTEVFNPAFSKNSPFIIAFDVREDFENSIYGVNLETQELNQIFMNTGLGYPNFSKTDEVLIYDLELLGYTDIGGLVLQEDKISSVSNSDGIISAGRKWGTWISTGQRILSDVEEVSLAEGILDVYPNPAFDNLQITLDTETFKGDANIEVINMQGKVITQFNKPVGLLQNFNLDISAFEAGSYILSIRNEGKIVSQQFIKQ